MKVRVDYNQITGEIKPMNAVNNGPIYTKNKDQNGGNLIDYRKANIPYARTHDASFCSRYGGEHTVDVHLIFRDFDADPYDPASYDFTLTDEYMEAIMLAGTKVFYRLGSKIEHEVKKYGTLPPKDFEKWAVICEHIIAHMNEGWADGHHYGITYWEIWNEPDMVADDAPYVAHKTWGGSREQFFTLYEIAAKHLKNRFPDLKIGGPAVTYANPEWTRPFLQRVKERNIPLDFFSWHGYSTDVWHYVKEARLVRSMLDEAGLFETESIFNEWNYVIGWENQDWIKSLKTMIAMKGAAFISAVMSAMQGEAVDLLMYYDARPSTMNGLFSAIYERYKGYYVIAAWGELLKMGKQAAAACDIPDIYVTAAADENGKKLAVLTYYTDDENAVDKAFTVELLGCEHDEKNIYLLDETHDFKLVCQSYSDEDKITLTMKPNTVVVIA